MKILALLLLVAPIYGQVVVRTVCGPGGPLNPNVKITAGETINAQSGASYNFQNLDCGKLVTFSNGGAIAAGLPQANSVTFRSGWEVDVQNVGSGTVTITPVTSTIDGAATLVMTPKQGARIVSNGANYFTARGAAGLNAGNVAVTSNTLKGDGAGNAVAVAGTATDCVLVDGSSGPCGTGGGATIPNTTNIIIGDGAGNGADSGYVAQNASTSLTGFLTSTDWNTFNGKGSVSSVATGCGASGGTITTTGTILGIGDCVTIANETGTGTTANKLVKLTGAPSKAIITGTGDTTGIIGVCDSGCGNTGSAVIQQSGLHITTVDGSGSTAGHWALPSTSIVGDTMDSGVASTSAPPAGAIGIYLQTFGGLSTVVTDLINNLAGSASAGGTVTLVTGANGLSGSVSTSGAISGVNAAADGTTKGVSAFTAADFDASSGVISLDYTNSQKATGSVPGFLSSTDWTTFNNKSSGLVNLPTPGSTCTFTAPATICVCTTTCTITVPVPAAGYQFCALNDDNVSTVITMSAIGSSARYENTARTAYGTAGTGTFVSGGAVKDMACLVGRDSTHYLTTNFIGTWTAN